MKHNFQTILLSAFVLIPFIVFSQNYNSPNSSDDINKSRIYQRKSIAFSFKKDYSNAILNIDTAILLVPYNGIFYAERASYKKESVNFTQEDILADYDKGISLEPNNIYLYKMRASYYQSIKKFQEAFADVEHVLKIKPEIRTAETLIRYRKESNLYNDKTIMEDFNSLIGEDPLSKKAMEARTHSFLDIKMYSNALEEYNNLISLEPKNINYYKGRARAKKELKRYDEAFADFQKALDISPNDASVYFLRGIMNNQMYHYKAAIAEFDSAIKYNPNMQNLYFNRAFSNIKTNNYQAAIDDYTKEINKSNRYENAYVNRAIAKRMMGRFKESLDEYDSVLIKWPNYNLALNNKAWINLFLGNSIDGMILLNKLVSLNPKYKRGLSQQLSALYNNANYEECIEKAGYIINNFTELEGDYYKKGKAKAKLHNYKDAIDEFNKSLVAYESNPARLEGDHDEIPKIVNISKAAAEISLGLLDSAITHCTKAISLDASYKQAYNTRGLAYYLQGNYAKALIDYDRAMGSKEDSSMYQPLYEYRNEAKNKMNTPLIFVEWLSPRDDINSTYKGTLYVAGQNSIQLKLRISSSKPLSKEKILLYQNNQVLSSSNIEIIVKSVHSFKVNYEYEINALVTFPTNISTLKVGYENNFSQVLTISQDRFPSVQQDDKFMYTYAGFLD